MITQNDELHFQRRRENTPPNYLQKQKKVPMVEYLVHHLSRHNSCNDCEKFLAHNIDGGHKKDLPTYS
jgi:hypothetical protein